MDIRKFRWSRAVALFVALTMVMMYSVTFTAFANINDVKVHYKGYVATGDKIVVEVVISGTTYTAICAFVSGNNYDGAFDPDIPLENGDKIPVVGTTITIQHGGNIIETLAMDRSSGVGHNSANIFVYSAETSPYYDLGITKSVNDNSVMLGDEVTFTIGITNNSDTSVSGIYASDVWPLGLSQGAVTADMDTSYDAMTNRWNVGTLEADETKMLTITAVTISPGSITNTINIESECLTGDTNPDNDSDNATVRVDTDYYDLGITKIADYESVLLGEEVTFVITIENSEKSEITVEGIYADDIWPEGLSISGITTEDGNSFNQETGRWDIGTLMPGQSRVLTISAIATAFGSLTNTINIGSDRPYGDTNTENDRDSDTVIVEGKDLGITKTANPTSMLLGASVDFVVMITNHGTIDAYDIDVTDLWPAGVSLSGIAADVDTTSDGITWSIDSLEAGESKTLTLSAVTTATGTIENVVGIMYADFEQFNVSFMEVTDMEAIEYLDGNLLNNTASAIINVSTQTTTTTTTTRRTTPTIIEEPVIPLTEEPVILEEPTPLADVVPQTNDTGNIWLLLGLLFSSGFGIATLGRRKEIK